MWTGGSTLYIEATMRQPLERSKETDFGSLQITGHLGDVMKESVNIAHTFAKSFLAEKSPNNTALQQGHIHLHVPEVSKKQQLHSVATGAYQSWLKKIEG